MFFVYGPPWFVITCFVIYLIATGLSQKGDTRSSRLTISIILSIFVIPVLAVITSLAAMDENTVRATVFSILLIGIGVFYVFCIGAYVGSLPIPEWRPYGMVRQLRSTNGNALTIDGRICCPVCKGDVISDMEMGEQFYQCAKCRMKLLPPKENSMTLAKPSKKDEQAMQWLDSN